MKENRQQWQLGKLREKEGGLQFTGDLARWRVSCRRRRAHHAPPNLPPAKMEQRRREWTAE
jgi:hypothetical protein